MNRTLSCLAFAVAFASGCNATLRTVTLEPTMLEPRGARRLVVADGEGRREARRMVNEMLADQLRNGWYTAGDASDDGIKLVLNGKRATVLPESHKPLDDDAYWVKVDVIDWHAEPAEVVTDADADEDGEPDVVFVLRATVTLALSVATEEGRVLVRDATVTSVVDGEPDSEPLAQLTAAAQQCVAELVDQLEPHQVAWSLRIDDSDPGQKAIVEGIKKGSLVGAKKALRAYLKRNKTNSIAHYNLGVVLDAQGRHDLALDEYDQAIEIQPRDYYFTTRDGAAHREKAHEALYGPRKKPKRTKPAAPEGTPEGEAPPAP